MLIKINKAYFEKQYDRIKNRILKENEQYLNCGNRSQYQVNCSFLAGMSTVREMIKNKSKVE